MLAQSNVQTLLDLTRSSQDAFFIGELASCLLSNRNHWDVVLNSLITRVDDIKSMFDDLCTEIRPSTKTSKTRKYEVKQKQAKLWGIRNKIIEAIIPMLSGSNKLLTWRLKMSVSDHHLSPDVTTTRLHHTINQEAMQSLRCTLDKSSVLRTHLYRFFCDEGSIQGLMSVSPYIHQHPVQFCRSESVGFDCKDFKMLSPADPLEYIPSLKREVEHCIKIRLHPIQSVSGEHTGRQSPTEQPLTGAWLLNVCDTPTAASAISSAMFGDILSDCLDDTDALCAEHELIREILPITLIVFDALESKREKLLTIFDWMTHGVKVDQDEPAYYLNGASGRALLSVLLIRYCGVDARLIFYGAQVFVRIRTVRGFPCVIKLESFTALPDLDRLAEFCDQVEGPQQKMTHLHDSPITATAFKSPTMHPSLSPVQLGRLQVAMKLHIDQQESKKWTKEWVETILKNPIVPLPLTQVQPLDSPTIMGCTFKPKKGPSVYFELPVVALIHVPAYKVTIRNVIKTGIMHSVRVDDEPHRGDSGAIQLTPQKRPLSQV